VSGIRRRGFFVGGAYAGAPDAPVMRGQMYVERLEPAARAHPYPLVLIHGAAQTGANWLATPDGRQGWAEWLAGRGWDVCMVDQPARGRSAWQPGLDGALKTLSVSATERLFTAPEQFPEQNRAWPQAKLHTQWPGGADAADGRKGRAGDPVFDQFYAGQVAYLDNRESEKLMRDAGVALLDRIGPAILVTHSQAGLFGWLIADARPELVKGIVALEPGGPPFKDALFATGTDREFGLTSLPLTYDPPVTASDPLAFEQQAEPDAPGLAACWSLRGKPRRLKNLAGIPVFMVTAEASYHATYDHCTARYLTQAGVAVEFVRLAERGIHGNGHMMMLELNSLEIAALVEEWLIKIG
jgi:pimeloyl-ACP methyl ester carboxylesterase